MKNALWGACGALVFAIPIIGMATVQQWSPLVAEASTPYSGTKPKPRPDLTATIILRDVQDAAAVKTSPLAVKKAPRPKPRPTK